MARIIIIGNAGGGKSVLARKIAAKRDLPYREIDTIVWRPGWEAFPQAEYEAAHAKLIAEENWVLDGLGWTETLPARFGRATEIILIDMPLWMHFLAGGGAAVPMGAGQAREPGRGHRRDADHARHVPG